MRDDLDKILLGENQIQQRLDELAEELRVEYEHKDLTVVGVLTGSVMFIADLLKRLPIRLRLDYIGVSSYRGSTAPSGDLVLTKKLGLDVRDHDVLVVDDVFDTGATLGRIRRMIGELGPRSLKLCVFLEKEIPHAEDVPVDYVAFRIPNEFVVGYGLDYRERYRNLPYVATLRQEVIGEG